MTIFFKDKNTKNHFYRSMFKFVLISSTVLICMAAVVKLREAELLTTEGNCKCSGDLNTDIWNDLNMRGYHLVTSSSSNVQVRGKGTPRVNFDLLCELLHNTTTALSCLCDARFNTACGITATSSPHLGL